MGKYLAYLILAQTTWTLIGATALGY